MKFSDIDFSSIANMMNNLSDEQKENLNSMAQNMMDKVQTEPEEEISFYEYLHIDEKDYKELPGQVLDYIEAASDMEQFYEDDENADVSAAALYYAKAVLVMEREYHFPIFKNVLQVPNMTIPATTTIQSYWNALTDENIHRLADEDFGSSDQWVKEKQLLQTVMICLNRAEYDVIHAQDLQVLKKALIDEQGLLQIAALQ